MNKFPEELNKYINGLGLTKDDIGRSEDEVYIFEDKYILKISNDKQRVLREKDRFDWLYSYLPTIKSLEFFEYNNRYYYLRTKLNGDSLISKRIIDNPELLIKQIKDVDKFLKSIDSCPFKSNDNEGNDFVHGDLCLPNIYVNEKNEFIGFIDLENCGIGDKWYDYSWLIWSFERNLGTKKYTKKLLEELGIEFNKDKYDKYIPLECIEELNRICMK